MPRSTRSNVIPFPVPPGTSKRLAKRPPEVAPPGAPLPAPASPARWFLGHDCSGHRYLVPSDRRAEWRRWASLPEDDQRGWNTPAYAVAFEGETLEFASPTLNGAPVTAPTPAKRGRAKGGRSK